ncbi:hypothetical protein ACFSQ7_12745 [Paenibacillus rhizoplanae]
MIGMVLEALEKLFTDIHLTKYLLINTLVRVKDLGSTADLIHMFGVAIAAILFLSYVAVRYKNQGGSNLASLHA